MLSCRVSRYHSYLNSAKHLIFSYNGEEPFSTYLKKYYAQHKKFGSKDRKEVTNLCYCNFRLGQAAMGLSIEERILTALFLCSSESNEILENLKPEWNENASLSLNEKLSTINYPLSSVFPWKEELSDGIEYKKFCASFFVQPDLFLRIRPGHAERVLLKLNEAGVNYEFISPFTIRLPNSFKADKYFELDNEVVVQDYNSQHISEFLPVRRRSSDQVWDCCAGSGGKSIMTHDLNPEIKLFVSDIRESILANLEKRFANAGIKKYASFIADLSQSPITTQKSTYDLVIADVPCTGSGTWGRTPEQLFYFDKKKIDEYAAIQKKIISNVILHLKPGGHLLYITCSVFKKENEEMVIFLKKKFPVRPGHPGGHLQVIKVEVLKGYKLKADTMFVALLQMPL